jgi:hypothetical protein
MSYFVFDLDETLGNFSSIYYHIVTLKLKKHVVDQREYMELYYPDQLHQELEKAYGPITIMYIFEVHDNRDFEKFLFSQKELSNYRYKKELIKNHNTKEIFLLYELNEHFLAF